MKINDVDDSLRQVMLIGRLDTPGVSRIETRFLAAVVPCGKHAIIDLSQVEFIASMGVRMLLSAARSLRQKEVRIALYAAQDLVNDVFQSVSMTQVVPVCADATGAIAAVRGWIELSRASMLAVRNVLNFEATAAGFERALGDLKNILDDAALPRKVRYNIEVVFEEIVTNIVRHGRSDRGTPHVEVSVELGSDAIVLVFTDDSVAFDPREHAEPAPFNALPDIQLGGLGISLARKASTSMTYERTPQHRNRLTVVVGAR